MTSAQGLMPITRDFLASYYDKYPIAPLSDDVSRLSTEICSFTRNLHKDSPLTEGESCFVNEADSQIPHKIDENLWKNREYIEEVIFLLERSHWPSSLQSYSTAEDAGFPLVLNQLRDKFEKILKVLEIFQSKHSERIFNTVMTYMPQDFRGALIRQQKERSERNKQAEVNALINSGASIRDRYALLWNQQMSRRTQLSQLGSATRVYKTLVKYLVGVPEVLLDFIRQINDDNGPMEEQRQRYGPPLYNLTKMVINIRLFLFLSWQRFDPKELRSQLAVLEQATDVYTAELDKFIKFIDVVFANSPFFISAETGSSLETVDDLKEMSIPAGGTYEVSLVAESINSYIAWDFSLIQGKKNMDIGFSLEYIYPTGQKTLILPYRRYESNQGSFCTLMAGNYKLIWDNSYSTFFKKGLRYKVECIPPVAEGAVVEE